MKWKTVIGIVLIIVSIAAMVFWETKGREMVFPPQPPVVNIPEGEIIEEPSVFENGDSYFNIPASWIYSRSSLMAPGYGVALYLMDEALERPCLGHYRIAAVEDAYVEILCKLPDYYMLHDILTVKEAPQVLMVMED